MQRLPAALAALGEFRQFLLYKLEPSRTVPGRTEKIPINQSLQAVNAHDSAHWLDADTAIRTAELLGDKYGAAFAFTKDDPFFFFDIDDCAAPGGGWTDIANNLLGLFAGAAVEVSQSGTGLHIFGTGVPTVASKLRRKKAVDPHTGNEAGLFDLYTESRFVALTFNQMSGDAATDHTGRLDEVVGYWLRKGAGAAPAEWSAEPCTGSYPVENDDDLVDKAQATASAASYFDDARATFRDLWEANDEVLAAAYVPDRMDSGKVYDNSKADQALAQHLAFWTGNDCERISRLMWQSALARDKWHREDYLNRTILNAVSMQATWYTGGKPADTTITDQFGAPRLKAATDKQRAYAETIRADKLAECQGEESLIKALCAKSGPSAEASFWLDNKALTPEELVSAVKPIEKARPVLGERSTPEVLVGYQLLGPDQQIEHFAGCIYIQELHRVLTPSGAKLKPEQFNATYGGYSFAKDTSGAGKVTGKAWEAFTESQAVRYPIAEKSCFRPDLPAGCILHQSGRSYVNTYTEIVTPRKQGDPSRFLEHLEILLPVERDRDILLAYMAACIQYQGVKFQWAPLIQGIEGNGKTLFTRCVAFAIGREYSHMPPAQEISEKYNSWLFGTIFVGVEDIYVPEHKREIIEILKPMITSDWLAQRAMQTDQIMQDVCCNFIFNSNYRNAVQKTRNDRRFCIFYTRQQNPEDIARDGLDGNYFPDLYAWLKGTGEYTHLGANHGYAVVAEYLQSYKIPAALDPSGACHRAPTTSSTDEAVLASLGGVEQEIIEAIEEGKPGFAGGWVSSSALKRLLSEIRAETRIPPNKRREVLQSLGYDWHPHLKNGRVNSDMPGEGGKPRLFIKKGNVSANLQTVAEIVKAYQKAQGAASGSVGPASEVMS